MNKELQHEADLEPERRAERQYTEEQQLRRCIGVCETYPEFKEKCGHLLTNEDPQEYWDLFWQ